MLTKAKAMYQVWLVIEGLSEKEKKLIPKELIDEIKNTMEIDESISIDFSIPLEKQINDEKVWKTLDNIIKKVEANKRNEANVVINSNIDTNTLTDELQNFKRESKELVLQYKKAYEDCKEKYEELKIKYDSLENSVNSIPKWVRKLFIKETKVKVLLSGKEE